MPTPKGKRTPFQRLSSKLRLVRRGLRAVKRGLNSAPDEDEKFDLLELELELEEEKLLILEQLKLPNLSKAGIPLPNDTQIAEIKKLSDQVETLTQQAKSASAALALSGKILDRLNEIDQG